MGRGSAAIDASEAGAWTKPPGITSTVTSELCCGHAQSSLPLEPTLGVTPAMHCPRSSETDWRAAGVRYQHPFLVVSLYEWKVSLGWPWVEVHSSSALCQPVLLLHGLSALESLSQC